MVLARANLRWFDCPAEPDEVCDSRAVLGVLLRQRLTAGSLFWYLDLPAGWRYVNKYLEFIKIEYLVGDGGDAALPHYEPP